MAGGRAFKSNVRERREAERRMKALEKRQKKEEKRREDKAAEPGGQYAPGYAPGYAPRGCPSLDTGTESAQCSAANRQYRRRTQVAKGEVCKTSIHRFESGRRLSTHPIPAKREP
jgi:hypothetical protein